MPDFVRVAPPDAAARLERLLDLPREAVKPELDDLVERTLELVERHLPEVETGSARGTWSIPATASDGPPTISG